MSLAPQLTTFTLAVNHILHRTALGYESVDDIQWMVTEFLRPQLHVALLHSFLIIRTHMLITYHSLHINFDYFTSFSLSLSQVLINPLV